MRVKRKMATTLVLSTALVLSLLATFSAARPAAAAYDDPDTPTTSSRARTMPSVSSPFGSYDTGVRAS